MQCVCVCAHIYVHTHEDQRLTTGFVTQVLPTLIFEAGSLSVLELAKQTSLAVQQTPGI